MTAFPLSTGGREDPFLPRLRGELHRADTIDLAVSFIMLSGLDLIFDDLVEAMEERDASIRILTTDYLNVTEPEALRRLMLLVERGADVRVFEARERSFHLKAYLLLRTKDDDILEGSAYIGSSNLTRTALLDGIEWNYRVDAREGTHTGVRERFLGIRAAFDTLFTASEAVHLTWAWIEAYEFRRPPVLVAPAPDIHRPGAPPPTPHEPQREALEALERTRRDSYQRGLVVMATGLGKTWLAAFDVARMNPERILFVAHREEILLQAERTFQRIVPNRRIGRYDGTRKEEEAELLFASIQTLSRTEHLDQFSPDHFDYVVVDEFHHAAAQTYRRVLRHFEPGFLLGLTATPSRTDRSDILSLCDDNLVYYKNLFDAISLGLLVPFGYWGIWDKTVDYQEIPWRSGRFDPGALEHRLATLSRARHVLSEWKGKRGTRTLAFCASRRHADFMADHFSSAGFAAASVHGASEWDRGSALDALAAGDRDVVFSVDLFNEGVDVPAVDTVMMLRPTESTVLFLQQLGRGLRLHESKERLTILDFVGNHRGFLHKPQALLGIEPNLRELAALGKKADEEGTIQLPDGCFVNFDLTLLNLWEEAYRGESGVRGEYRTLRDSLGRRPTAAEFHRAGGDAVRLRRDPGHWWALVREEGDLSEDEAECLARHEEFFQEVETTAMTKSFKMILLQTLIDHDGFREPPSVENLSAWGLEMFRRRRRLTIDVAKSVRDVEHVDSDAWHRYWSKNPINAWVGGNREAGTETWFEFRDGRFRATFDVGPEEAETFHVMLQELVDLRLARYGERLGGGFAEAVGAGRTSEPSATTDGEPDRAVLPVFPNVAAAARWREAGQHSSDPSELASDDDVPTPPATREVGPGYGTLRPQRHFLVPTEGGENDGKMRFLLLEWVEAGDRTDGGREERDPDSLDSVPDLAAAFVGEQVVVAYPGAQGVSEYLVRTVEADEHGRMVLRQEGSEYAEKLKPEGATPVARVLGTVA